MAIHKKISIKSFSEPGMDNASNIATIWVHGTGQNPLLRKWHLSPKGLSTLAEIPDGWGLKRMGFALHAHDNREFSHSHFYAFGWSGKLSFKVREEAGRDLDAAIRRVCASHEERYGSRPRLRIIAHSHGCNVVLNASDYFLTDNDPLIVDEVVFLACPVQHATAHKIASPAFRHIFALYSTRDLLQVMDPQGLNREKIDTGGKFFSGRHFDPQPNLIQAEILWNGARLTHVGFVRERFGKALPTILAELRATKLEKPIHDEHYVITIV